MQNNEANQLKLLQLSELEIFKVVTKVAMELNLRYYALGGTLLGAVRHQGFIPWDDDIDIAMPRPDYETFLAEAQKLLPDNLRVVTYKDSKPGELCPFFCQVQKTDSEVVLEFSGTPRKSRIWLDIFPLDAMPSNSLLRKFHKLRLLYYRMKVQFSMYEENAHQHRANRPIHEKLLMKFREVTKFGSSWDTAEMFSELENELKRYSYSKESYIVNMMGAYKFKEMFPKSWFDKAVMLPFEDTLIACPNEYDKVLSQMYGDYMVPPPNEARKDQHRMTIIKIGEPSWSSYEESDYLRHV